MNISNRVQRILGIAVRAWTLFSAVTLAVAASSYYGEIFFSLHTSPGYNALARWIIIFTAVMVVWFSLQLSNHWLPWLMLPVVIVWNPLFPIHLERFIWSFFYLFAAFIMAGAFVVFSLGEKLSFHEQRKEFPRLKRLYLEFGFAFLAFGFLAAFSGIIHIIIIVVFMGSKIAWFMLP